MVNSNRKLLDAYLYPSDRLSRGHDVYILARRNKIRQYEILGVVVDVTDTDNVITELNKLNDGWEYFFLESDLLTAPINLGALHEIK